MKDFCNDLKVIPQFVGSCWFNAILMASLYSQYSRKILINVSKKWNKKDKFLNILRNILKKNYNDPSIANYYNQIQPQLLLFKFLKKYDVEIEKIIKNKIKNNITNFGWNNFYYPTFLKILDNKVLDIRCDMETKTNIINFHKNMTMSYKNDIVNIKYEYKKINIEKEKNEILKLIKDVPNYIVVFHSDISTNSKIISTSYNILKKYNEAEANVFDLASYDVKFDGLTDYKDDLIFNDVKYKLDSCLLGNFDNGINKHHSIAGITCNGNRYVYNGWTKKTYDPALNNNNNIKNGNMFPCSLMKYDWDLRKDEDFCLNSKLCKLDFIIKKKDLCFSFSKGQRILVYVRVDEEKTTNITTLNSSQVNLTDIKKLIKDIYQIDKLNEDELKKHLLFFIMNENKEKNEEKLFKNIQNYFRGKNIDDMKELLFENIIKNYDIPEKKNKNFISRKNVYKNFKSLKNFKGKLLKQQIFLADFINSNYDNIDKMLLFHGIGTGKTCTSITIAESIMSKNISMKVLVILPARLKTNYIDELISEKCGMNKYISTNDYNKYINTKTSKNDKDIIRKKFMKKISDKYEIISYENLRNRLLKSTDIRETIDNITKNRIVIIDEIHNLITSKINNNTIENILKNNKIPKKTKMINGIIMRLMTYLANKTSKFFLLTATPVFDNFGQFIELVLNLRPDIKENELKRNINDLEFLVEKLRGKVSFYKLKDLSDYPKTIIDNIEIPLSKTQDNLINFAESSKNENSNMFCINERQISISTYGLNNKDKVFSNLTEYAPKLKKLFELLTLDGKHVVYSNFINYCLYLIAAYLKQNGWNNYIEDGIKKNKTFVIWDASLNDDNKQDVKNILNSISNIDGSDIKIVLGSPSIKEGISFLHVQHLHQIDPVWNSSAKTQVEGRCIRFKSHEDIPLNHPTLKRNVVIHNYISVARKGGLVLKTCDSKIYYEIIKKKEKVISLIERLLGKVAIDYYLWTDDKSPKGKSSNISLSKEKEELEEILKKKTAKERNVVNKNKNNCPVIRRPTENKCLNPNFPFIRVNAKGFPCCYKKVKK
jgi:hypothetical protein